MPDPSSAQRIIHLSNSVLYITDELKTGNYLSGTHQKLNLSPIRNDLADLRLKKQTKNSEVNSKQKQIDKYIDRIADIDMEIRDIDDEIGGYLNELKKIGNLSLDQLKAAFAKVYGGGGKKDWTILDLFLMKEQLKRLKSFIGSADNFKQADYNQDYQPAEQEINKLQEDIQPYLAVIGHFEAVPGESNQEKVNYIESDEGRKAGLDLNHFKTNYETLAGMIKLSNTHQHQLDTIRGGKKEDDTSDLNETKLGAIFGFT
ncbi:3230_t:CDS:1, partial [Cetraspora pellucida]